MNKPILNLFFAALFCVCISCEKQNPEPPAPEVEKPGFTEEIPDTTVFTNAEFIYNGDDVGEATSDGWQIKMYTDMDIDETGAPIGPGTVAQLLLNVTYDENQSGDPEFLPGIYKEMYNSGNFAPGTFVSGYMTSIDLPGERIELADATFYAELESGSTEMDYDLIDEGAVQIKANEDGTYTITGILVGKKYLKRHFTWTGEADVRSYVPEVTPNSTLTEDLNDVEYTKGQLQDKGDYFYLRDESYRCLLLFLGDDGIDMSMNRPAGNGKVMRLEMLVPWDIDITEDGIPAGTYTMAPRNADTSIDKDNIVPGAAVPGLPNVFTDWKVSGSWYYELKDGVWTDTYARIDKGTISVERGENGSYTIVYDLLDCQEKPFSISGELSFDELDIIDPNPDPEPEPEPDPNPEPEPDPNPEPEPDPNPEPEPEPEPEIPVATEMNTYILNGSTFRFGSAAVVNIGDNIGIAACPAEGISGYEAILEQRESFFVAIAPNLNGESFDMMTETSRYTVMSTLNGAYIESIAPGLTEEITAGRCQFGYYGGEAFLEIGMILADGRTFAASISAEENNLNVNENTISLNGEEKPIRTIFHTSEDGLTYLYITPAGIDYSQDLEITTYYTYMVIDDSKCDGSTISADELASFGIADNLNGKYTDSSEYPLSGTVSVLKDPSDPECYTITADVTIGSERVLINYNGEVKDYLAEPEVVFAVVFDRKSYEITDVTLDKTVGNDLWRTTLKTTGEDVTITLPSSDYDGNPKGFSQFQKNPEVMVTYGDEIFNKSTGASGTIIVSIDGDKIHVEFTNYNNFEVLYEGPFNTIE